jgi:hypothetical protein
LRRFGYDPNRRAWCDAIGQRGQSVCVVDHEERRQFRVVAGAPGGKGDVSTDAGWFSHGERER